MRWVSRSGTFGSLRSLGWGGIAEFIGFIEFIEFIEFIGFIELIVDSSPFI